MTDFANETAGDAMHLYGIVRTMLSSGDVPAWAIPATVRVVNKLAAAYGDGAFTRAGNLSPAYQLRQDQERRGVS